MPLVISLGVVRNDVYYPVKFYGKVVAGTDGRKHWIGGENIKAVVFLDTKLELRH
jgi:hypothetical protein